MTKLLAVISLIGLPVILVAAPWITSFLHLSSLVLFILVYLIFVISLLSIAPVSMLQGYQRFVWISVFGVAAVAIKILLSVPMTRWGVYGVLLAAALAAAFTYVLYYFPLRFVLTAKSEKSRLSKRDAFRFALPTLLIQLGVTSLYTTDIILVRHFFPSPEAGLYAAIAILGKVIFYASSSVSLVLFPVLSERTASGAATKRLTASAIGGVAAISAGITILYFLFPHLIVGLLFGNAYAGAGSFLGSFGIFLALYSIGGIIVTACLALGRTGIWFVPVICAILQIAGITVWHGNIATVISLNIGICTLYVLGSAAYYLKGSYAKI
jgi:O-antigen/teichoic acid export membrane protein